MPAWLRRLLRMQPRPASSGDDAGESMWLVQPPEGVRLVSSRPSKTGQGGRGVVARYSDGTTASAMVNSDGSASVLFFQAGQGVPAIPVEGQPARFTWDRGQKPKGRWR